KSAFALLLFIGRTEEYEEQCVIQHDHIRSKQTLARVLIKTARILATSFLRADMRFAANLRPYFWIGLDSQIAERSVSCDRSPCGESLQFVLLRSREEFLRALQRAFEPARAKVILPPLH